MTGIGRPTRVLAELSHGSHALVDNNPEAEKSLQEPGTDSALSRVVNESVSTAEHVGTTSFGYLFAPLSAMFPHEHLPSSTPEETRTTVDALNALGDAMVDHENSPVADSTIPPVYTYWGQFVDHDITANTDRDTSIDITGDPLVPIAPREVLRRLENLRSPALNLDSVYGDGPFVDRVSPNDEAVPYDGITLRLGEIQLIPDVVPPADDLARDLPRRGEGPDPETRRTPQIGDGRNDENLVVAQLHVAFLRFHNAAVDWVRANEPHWGSEVEVFLRARDLTRWAYQWLTVHDYLPTVTAAGTVDTVLTDDVDLLALQSDTVYMPLEFSVAAFRFGHSMVRAAYDWNAFFGRDGDPGPAPATFEQLFQFTGRGGFAGPLERLPSNWPADWNRLVHKNDPDTARFARKIDTHLALPLSTLRNEGTIGDPELPVNKLLKQLARRNLLRGFRLALPTGQAVAQALEVPALTRADLENSSQPVRDALAAGGFLDRTPLWFYILKEAEVQRDGQSLGAVGSTIVAATLIGQLRADRRSYLNQTGWSPAQGVRLPDGSPVRSIVDFLRFAGVLT
ncbi:peroxidase family protein [Pseudonocardia xinjiangensis]|uniref:peroxidase family protein n=1 Tax=Pseudonocardia xinjiangensis TaxID=75289 RepID=UPI003D8CA828